MDLRFKIERYRRIFLQFHTVLGAYLLYKENYKAISEIWFFTQSQPPRYSLMPMTMDEIFDYYFTFLKDHWQNPDIAISYRFKDLGFDNMNGKLDVKYFVRKYACLLFLRQWISGSYYGHNPLAFPQIPKKQPIKKFWLDNFYFFKKIVQDHLENEVLINSLGLEKVTVENCEKDKIPYPISYLDDLKNRIEADFEEEQNNSELDEEKKSKLDKYTVELLTKTYNQFQRVSGSVVLKNERDSISNTLEAIRGTRMLLDKEAFIKNSSTTFLFYDEVVAQAINDKYYNHISLKFNLNSTLRYKVPNGQSFQAVDRLKLESKKHVIIAFKVNIKYLSDYHNIEIEDKIGNEDYLYKSVPIYCFNNCNPSAFNSLYVLKRDEMPMINHIDWSDFKDLPEAVVKRWKSMDNISQELKLYRKFTELNKSVELKAEYINNGKEEEELKNKLEVDIDFIAHCWFKKGIKMIEIKESDKFQEGGIKNQLSDIKPFESSPDKRLLLLGK